MKSNWREALCRDALWNAGELFLQDDFFGEGLVVRCAVAVGSVFEDRLTETGGFGKANISSNPGFKELCVAKEFSTALGRLEEFVDVGADFRSQSRIGVIHTEHDAGKTKLVIQST